VSAGGFDNRSKSLHQTLGRKTGRRCEGTMLGMQEPGETDGPEDPGHGSVWKQVAFYYREVGLGDTSDWSEWFHRSPTASGESSRSLMLGPTVDRFRTI
jgi:hypothetical protein